MIIFVFLSNVQGAYYHKKFRRDDRDLCLSITRTKAPKRSRATSSVHKKKFCQNVPPFQSRKNNTHVTISNNNDLEKVVSLNTNLPSDTISRTLFDDVSPFQQTSLPPQQKCNMKVPQHKTSLSSNVSFDCTSSSKCDHTASSSTSRNEPAHGSFSSQQLKTHQPLEPAIADTCQWLINAGVPISAFDPVAIGDVSNSTFCVPPIVSSNSAAFISVNPKQSKIPETIDTNHSLSHEKGSTDKIQTEPLDFHNGVANNDINCLIFPPSHNQVDLASAFQDTVSPFDNDDSLLTDLLPGENLPVVDDSLWAL